VYRVVGHKKLSVHYAGGLRRPDRRVRHRTASRKHLPAVFSWATYCGRRVLTGQQHGILRLLFGTCMPGTAHITHSLTKSGRETRGASCVPNTTPLSFYHGSRRREHGEERAPGKEHHSWQPARQRH